MTAVAVRTRRRARRTPSRPRTHCTVNNRSRSSKRRRSCSRPRVSTARTGTSTGAMMLLAGMAGSLVGGLILVVGA